MVVIQRGRRKGRDLKTMPDAQQDPAIHTPAAINDDIVQWVHVIALQAVYLLWSVISYQGWMIHIVILCL